MISRGDEDHQFLVILRLCLIFSPRLLPSGPMSRADGLIFVFDSILKHLPILKPFQAGLVRLLRVSK